MKPNLQRATRLPPCSRAKPPLRLKSYALLAASTLALLWMTGAVSQSRPLLGIVGSWPGRLCGDAKCVAVAGRYAYLGLAVAGQGGCEHGWRGRLEVLDVSSPAQPVWVGGCDLRDAPKQVQALTNGVLVASGSKLYVIDATTPSRPTVVGVAELGGGVNSVQVQGSWAYALADSTVQVFDLFNPAAPRFLGAYDLGRETHDVRVAGHRVYVATGDGLRVLEMSDPAKPVMLWEKSAEAAYALEVSGDYAYVATATELNIVKVTDPAAPVRVGAALIGARAKRVRALGSLVGLLAGNRLEVLDVSNPAQPNLVGGYDSGSSAQDLALLDRFAFVAVGAAGLQVLELSEPTAPAPVGRFETLGPAEAVQVVGNFAFLAQGDSGLQVIDLTHTNGLIRVGRCQTAGYARALHVLGNNAYVAVDSSLQIVDVADPTGPVTVGVLEAVGGGTVEDVHVVGSLAYLAAGSLEVIDVNEPSQPRRMATAQGVLGVRAVRVIGRFAYVGGTDESTGQDGLVVLEVSPSAQPRRVGACATVAPVEALCVVGDRVTVLASHPGDLVRYLQMVDVRNPGRPTPLGQCVVSETAHALQVVGHYAFVAGGSCDEDAPAWRDGLMIVDVSNPAHPARVAGLTTPGWAAGIQVVGDRAYLADGPGGLLIVSLPEALPSALFHPAWRDGVFTVAVPTHGGQGYALEFKRALDETQWTPLPLVPGAGGVQTLTDPSATDPRRFYRVVSY